MLKAGVTIYEVRPDADVSGAELVAGSGARATLHTKAFLVDRHKVFIGSFNFDPRSANLNTESGVIIESAVLGAEFGENVEEGIEAQCWRGVDDGQETIYRRDPESSWWQRFVAGLVRVLPVKSQL